jgi:hypothetical protein
LNPNGAPAQAQLERIGKGWRDEYAAMLLELVGFIPTRATQIGVLAQLERVSGLPFDGDLDRWYRWLWSAERATHPDYAEFKAGLYESIDPRFREYFAGRPKALIRLDEIRWGGVWRDGIPPLKNPKMIRAREARYLADGDIVFGVAIDGDVRAYPKRILAWHEMVKDTTSGFLYRSNKLMYDHATKSLWSTFGGTPVVGPLVGKGIELKPLNVVTTTWKDWKQRHPQTLVLSLDTGHQRDYSEGAAYREYFATDRLMFTVPKLDSRLPNKAEVLALRFEESALAISADFLRANRVYQDRLGGQNFVVLTDASGANRVYEAAGIRFESWDGEASARDRLGRGW